MRNVSLFVGDCLAAFRFTARQGLRGRKRLFDPVEDKNCVRQIEKMELLFHP
jgi:hypothetical protein